MCVSPGPFICTPYPSASVSNQYSDTLIELSLSDGVCINWSLIVKPVSVFTEEMTTHRDMPVPADNSLAAFVTSALPPSEQTDVSAVKKMEQFGEGGAGDMNGDAMDKVRKEESKTKSEKCEW